MIQYHVGMEIKLTSGTFTYKQELQHAFNSLDGAKAFARYLFNTEEDKNVIVYIEHLEGATFIRDYTYRKDKPSWK